MFFVEWQMLKFNVVRPIKSVLVYSNSIFVLELIPNLFSMKTLKTTILLLFTSVYTFANISSNEKDALIAIFNATNGVEWNSTWDLSKTADKWYGIKLENDKVVEINLQFNNLQGTLPEALGSLVHLRKINFGFNKLTGQLPKSISNLKELISLELFMNGFEGNIPDELGGLSKLESLKLYSNKFTGSIPVSLMSLTNLKELLLGSNYLTGNIPKQIHVLSKLQKLSLMDNKLDGEIPVEIAQLTNLEELLLSTNLLTGDVPLEFVNLTKLNTIMVSDNNLNQEYISISGKTSNGLLQLEMQNSTAIMDIEKE